MITVVTKENFKKEVEESVKPVVIDIYASWCGPCQMVKPVFEQVAQELSSKYTFAEVNVDEARDLAIKFGVTSVPTFIFMFKNEILGKERGYMSVEDFKAKLKTFFGE